jgi:FtsH-binding integral membrane protein
MMSDYHAQTRSVPMGREDIAIDPGLRRFMLGVYLKMGLGLAWSAALAYVIGTVAPVSQFVLSPPVVYIVMWGPVAILLGSSFLMRNPSPAASGVLYWSVVTLMGAGLSFWVLVAANAVPVQSIGGQTYNVTFETMAKAFLVTTAAFGGLSLWGYTTKRNLGGLHSMVIMGAWGLFAIALLNFLIFKSGMMEIILQAVTLVLFSVLVATQTNQLRETYYHIANDMRSQAVATNMGALNLYIAFITIFQTLLRFMSLSRD